MDNNSNRPEDKGRKDSPHRDEFDRMVEQIKAKRRAMSKSIWTDEPLLKPYKSIWIDDDEDIEPEKTETQEQETYEPPKPPVQETIEQAQPEPEPQPEPEAKPDPFNAHTPEYYEPNPVIKDARNEQLAFGVEPEHYDEVIMPFVNEYSVERRLPDQRRRISRKPKANAAVDYVVQKKGGKPAENGTPKTQDAAPVVHKLRHERFFDEEGEPLSRHDPEKSRRKRPQMVPLSRRKVKDDIGNDSEGENE